MSIAYVVAIVLWAVWLSVSAVAILVRARWITQALADYDVPASWWPWLGTARAAGAAGILAGLVVPLIGVTAMVGLVLYFFAAVAAVIRTRGYSHSALLLVS